MQGVESLSLQEQYSVTLSNNRQHISDGLAHLHVKQLRSKTLQVRDRIQVSLEATSVSHPVQILGGQQQEKAVYKGIYSDWSVEKEDVREVIAYRAGLNVAALGEPLLDTGLQLSHKGNTLTWSASLLCSFAGRDRYMPHIFKLCTRCLAKCRGGSWCCWLGCFTILSAYVCYPNQALHAGENRMHPSIGILLSHCPCISASHIPSWHAGFVWSRRSRCIRPCTYTGDHVLIHPLILVLWFHGSQQTTVSALALKQDVLSRI